MGKYHNLLYIAMKLSFDWSLQDNGVVAALLDELYACEGTFERIFLGKPFSVHITYLQEITINGSYLQAIDRLGFIARYQLLTENI